MGANYALGQTLHPHIGEMDCWSSKNYHPRSKLFTWDDKFFLVNEQGDLVGSGGIDGYWTTSIWATDVEVFNAIYKVYEFFKNNDQGLVDREHIEEYMKSEEVTEMIACEEILDNDAEFFDIEYMIYRMKDNELSYEKKDLSEGDFMRELSSILKLEERLEKLSLQDLKIAAEIDDDREYTREVLINIIHYNDDLLREVISEKLNTYFETIDKDTKYERKNN